MRLVPHYMFTILAISLFEILTGCDAVAQYAGEGRFIDNGPSAATDRYVVDLGPVSLNSPLLKTSGLIFAHSARLW